MKRDKMTDPAHFHTAAKPLNLVNTKPPENSVKGAVKLDAEISFYLDIVTPHNGEFAAQLVTFDKDGDLSAFIDDMCVRLQLPKPSDQYALMFTDPAFAEKTSFLTKQNKKAVVQGFFLLLTAAPSYYAKVLLEKLTNARYEFDQFNVLQLLLKHAPDLAFAQPLHDLGGIQSIIDMVEKEKCSGKAVSMLLNCLMALMEHNLVGWNDVSEDLVCRIALYVSGRSKHEDPTTLSYSLSILDSLVCNGDRLLPLIKREVPFESLIRHLEKSDRSIQQNALALMNSLFLRADPTSKDSIAKLLHSTPVRLAIENTVLNPKTGTVSASIMHQLGVLQRLLFNYLAIRSQSKPTDADLDLLHELRKLVPDALAQPLSPTQQRKASGRSAPASAAAAKDFRKLGFSSPEFPLETVQTTPPGLLAVDCMLYYARHHGDKLRTMLFENTLQADRLVWPFAAVSVQLVKELADILQIGNPPLEDGETFVEMLLKTEHPFEDFFSSSVNLFQKNWREMHASVEDISRVISVARDQITRSLQAKPATLAGFEEELKKYTFPKIQQFWQRERKLREESELQAKPIIELRERLRGEIVDLVKANRLNVMKRGQVFAKVGKAKGVQQKGQQFWLWRLDPNEKMLHYMNCDEENDSTLVDVSGSTMQKLSIRDITDVLTGRQCPHVQQLKAFKKSGTPLAFSLAVANPSGSTEEFNFTVSDEKTYNAWVDGLHALLGRPMTSEEAKKETDALLNLEVKIRLLALDGLPKISNEGLLIPALPSDFDWVPVK